MARYKNIKHNDLPRAEDYPTRKAYKHAYDRAWRKKHPTYYKLNWRKYK